MRATSPAQDVLQVQFKEYAGKIPVSKGAPVSDSLDVGYLLALALGPSPAVRFVIVPCLSISWWISSCFAYLAYSPEPRPERERDENETLVRVHVVRFSTRSSYVASYSYM